MDIAVSAEHTASNFKAKVFSHSKLQISRFWVKITMALKTALLLSRVCGYRRRSDWWLDLLTTLPHKLGTTRN
jgi:hypothetical protein